MKIADHKNNTWVGSIAALSLVLILVAGCGKADPRRQGKTMACWTALFPFLGTLNCHRT